MLVSELDSIRKDEETMDNFKGMANGLIEFTDGIKTSQRMIRNLREQIADIEKQQGILKMKDTNSRAIAIEAEKMVNFRKFNFETEKYLTT